ncbi:MAG: DUF3857 and transglutaminase domain-containing protein [Acidobacteriia bacterium]|nr:DUF3857 and transglutaminase domain-containing protein [Terriglobia bacterium]
MSNFVRLVTAVVCAGLWACAGTAALGDELQSIPPDQLTMTSEPKAPGAQAIYLYRQVDRDDVHDSREFNFVRLKVLTEEGRKYADVEIPFLKQQGDISGIKARTIQPDGTVIDFHGKVYEKTIVKAKGVKYLAKTFTLTDVRVGSILEYSYNVDFNRDYVYDSHWILSVDLFTKHAKFSLKPSPHFLVRWNWPVGLPAGTEPPKEANNSLISMEAQNVPAFQVEDYMPPEDELKFRVEFIYSEEHPEMNPEKFWKQQDKKWYGRFDDFVNKRGAMEKAISSIVAPSDPPETKLLKIYARVQQIRNLSFEREKTQQEEKREKQKDINNVEDVWKLGYGYSRQINWLFIALARAAGFDAAPVYVAARNAAFFHPQVVNPRQLTADLVVVKVDGKDEYLDPSVKFAPYGVLPWYETLADGIRLDKDGGQMVTTTAPDSSSARVERKADLQLSADDGSLEGKLTVTYSGLEALDLRLSQRHQDEASQKKLLEDMVRESIPIAIEVDLTNKPDWTSSSPTLVAEYHLKVPGWVSGAGRRALFPMGLFSANEKHVFEHANRSYPLYFQNAYLRSDDVTVNLPVGWKVGSVPVPINQDAKAVVYNVRAVDDKGTLHITRSLRNELVWLDKDKYGILRNFFQLVRTGDEQQVVLQPTL